MQVRALVPHFSTDGRLHEAGDEYDLAGDEAAFRLKDQIVAPVTIEPAFVPPQIGSDAGTPSVPLIGVVAVPSAAELAPPSNPEE